MSRRPTSDAPTWLDPQGKPVACVEKIKVLNDNLAELRQMAQDAFEDAVLMGCDEGQIRRELENIMLGLYNPYQSGDGGC